MSQELTLDEARRLGLLGTATRPPRKNRRAPTMPAAPNPGPNRHEHLARAALRGWPMIESDHTATRYRLRRLDGTATAWMSYEDVTARYGGPREAA